MREQFIELHPAAPPKPPESAPCNGCGVCCAQETCPAGRLRFLQSTGPCPALNWDDAMQAYRCGLLSTPEHFLPWLPTSVLPRIRPLFYRWIAAGIGCDCNSKVSDPDR